MKPGKMKIGWAMRDVTPEGKVSLRGQFHVRVTDEINDPITTTALALESEDNTEQAIIVSLDAVGVADYVLFGCRDVLIKEIPDFDPTKLFISATHTHTAPDQPGRLLSVRPKLDDSVMSEEAYGDFLIKKISEAAVDAWNNRKIGALSWGRGHAVVGFNRRVSYFDGSTVMYGKTDGADFSHIEGYEDHGIDMLFAYDDSHKLTGMLLNVPCPSQCTEHDTKVSADYWDETRRALRGQYGDDLFILPQCAAAGDQSPRTMIKRDADARMLRLKGYGEDYNIARRRDIADKILAAVKDVEPLAAKEIHDQVEFGHKVETLALTRRVATKEDLETAEKEVASWTRRLEDAKGEGPGSCAYSSAYRHVGFNQRVIDLYHSQKKGEDLTLPVELHVLRIGDIAMCTNRFEYFLDFGLRIKARSKALQTFVVQLAGEGTYLPTERGMRGGSYGAYIASTPVGPEGGQEIVEWEVKEINDMF